LNNPLKIIHALLAGVLFCLALIGCSSDSPERFNPGIPASPSALTGTAGNGQVSLIWTPPADAVGKNASYNIYYATTPGVTKNAHLVEGGQGSSLIVPGLTNNVAYYFAVSAISTSGESPLSAEITVTPALPGPTQQTDLQGTWNFNALVTGPAARWMRGSIAVDGAGQVVVSSFLDSAGNTVAPSDLFTTFTILTDGSVVQSGAAASFRGTLSANQYLDLLVGTATTGGSSHALIIMQKRVPGIVYSATDIQGTGQQGAGPLAYVYHQLASGLNQEWEAGSGQVGRDQSETYTSINAPSARSLPGAGSKVVSLSITSDGLVSESALAGVLPQPAALLTNAVMSADKMMIVGTATDASGAFILRIIQLVHPPSVALTATSFLAADLAGSYAFHDLVGGGISSWSQGSLQLDLAGVASVTSYLDASGSSVLPAPKTIAMDAQGILTNAADAQYSGKLSYFKDLSVATGTDAAGIYRLSIALKR
jgi:hypothetical protein